MTPSWIAEVVILGFVAAWALSAVRGARRRARREAAELITERARAYHGPTRLALLDVARELLGMPLLSGRPPPKASPPSPAAGVPEASTEEARARR